MDKKHLAPQMIKIIEWVGKLEELEFEASEGEVSSSVSFSTPFREDRIHPSFPAEEAVANSPEKDKGFIKVPKVIEEK
jgi:aspartyl-tRNA(Asn)/glutamyl-tRNA(Gln) amidotransferase subunit C